MTHKLMQPARSRFQKKSKLFRNCCDPFSRLVCSKGVGLFSSNGSWNYIPVAGSFPMIIHDFQTDPNDGPFQAGQVPAVARVCWDRDPLVRHQGHRKRLATWGNQVHCYERDLALHPAIQKMKIQRYWLQKIGGYRLWMVIIGGAAIPLCGLVNW